MTELEPLHSNIIKSVFNPNQVSLCEFDEMPERKLTRLEARKVRQRLAEINPSNASPQLRSPLFNTLPPEIRNIIFKFALSAYLLELDCPCSQGNCLPWHQSPIAQGYKPRIDTNLLLTCRLVYYETAALPMRLTTLHVSGRCEWDAFRMLLNRFTSSNVHYFHDIHLLGGGYEDEIPFGWSTIFSHPNFQPNHLTFVQSRSLNPEPRLESSELFIAEGEPIMWPLSLQTLNLEVIQRGSCSITKSIHTLHQMFPIRLCLGNGHMLTQRKEASLLELCPHQPETWQKIQFHARIELVRDSMGDQVATKSPPHLITLRSFEQQRVEVGASLESEVAVGPLPVQS